jgi:hypothetical protein
MLRERISKGMTGVGKEVESNFFSNSSDSACIFLSFEKNLEN